MTLSVARLLALASCVSLSACDTPTSGDGKSRTLVVQNLGETPVIGFYAAPASAGASRVDLMPGAGFIAPGAARAFNLDDGNGTCIFNLRASFASGVDTEMRNGNICEAIANGQAWLVSDQPKS
ncbi:hypothetical protein ACXYMO_05345 [Arenibacterium sp. CAU 1754]